MNIVPLAPIPAQLFNLNTDGGVYTISIYTKNVGGEFTQMFADVTFNGNVLRSGRLLENKNRIIFYSYLRSGSGDFAIVDTQGNDDPDFSSLGIRWQLVHYSPSECDALDGLLP